MHQHILDSQITIDVVFPKVESGTNRQYWNVRNNTNKVSGWDFSEFCFQPSELLFVKLRNIPTFVALLCAVKNYKVPFALIQVIIWP